MDVTPGPAAAATSHGEVHAPTPRPGPKLKDPAQGRATVDPSHSTVASQPVYGCNGGEQSRKRESDCCCLNRTTNASTLKAHPEEQKTKSRFQRTNISPGSTSACGLPGFTSVTLHGVHVPRERA